jgi:hypothetical protein
MNDSGVLFMLRERWGTIATGAGLVLLAYWAIHGFGPGASRGLPAEVANRIQDHHVECITPEETAIWPGKPRQPECGRVDLQVVAGAAVPPSARAEGVQDALCYIVTYENPFWTTQGTTRHEVHWSSRTAHKVALLKGGSWSTFPDQEPDDHERWKLYACPQG